MWNVLDSKQTEERLRKDGNVLSTAITEKKAEHQKQISNAKEHLSKAVSDKFSSSYVY